jgi:uncharacterized protein (TIGR00255 family)
MAPQIGPLFSMTGFGTATNHEHTESVTVELRTVNSRFLELHFKIPDSLRHLESALKELIQGQLKRGKVECRINIKSARDPILESKTAGPSLAFIQQIKALEEGLLREFPNAARLSIAQILSLGGPRTDADETPLSNDLVLDTTKEALKQLVQTRAREGTQLYNLLKSGLQNVRNHLTPLINELPQLIEAQQDKLCERLKLALSLTSQNEANPASKPATWLSLSEAEAAEVMQRVRQEVAALGLKADISEEIGRLEAHVHEFHASIGSTGPHGKRLDFLIQEMNREANTIGSKATHLKVTHASLGLKQSIEQLREQVQNIE